MANKCTYYRFLVVLIFSLLCISNGKAKSVEIAYAIDNYWSRWTYKSYEIAGTYADFVLFKAWDHPSAFSLRIKVNNYSKPSKSTIKDYIKMNRWFEYSGTVEYWVSEEYPTIKDALKKTEDLVSNPDSKHSSQKSGAKVKRTANAKIKIQFNKDGTMRGYNLFFDGIGYGIDCN